MSSRGDRGHPGSMRGLLTYSAGMGSAALAEWQSNRDSRIHELYAAHSLVGGSNRGRRYATEQLNWSITLRLAGEFQGFVRDLHDEAVDVFLARCHHPTRAFESNLRILLSSNRQLSNRNATSSTLQQDFGRFGFLILDDIKSGYRYGPTWLKRLEELNMARNGVAHDDQAKMAAAAGGGGRLGLRRVREWHSAVRGLAQAFDRVTAENLAKVMGGEEPW